MVKRAVETELRTWQGDPERKPLILRGSRQVGKSYIVEAFGREHFDNILVVNFELYPQFCEAFSTLEPSKILSTLSLLTKQSVNEGSTLLFLDEIQLCPNALKSLRYFYEKMPGLHVIAAGSLLEFALKDKDFSMPVGRVQYCYLKPLSFKEFLVATGNEGYVDYLSTVTLETGVEPALHEQLLELVRLYMVVGGMPAAVSSYCVHQDLLRVHRLQSEILQSYRSDFGKYASRFKHKYLERLFEKAPGLIAKQFKYVDVDPALLSRDLKEALGLLKDAGIFMQIFSTSASGLPLGERLNEKKFKLLFLDVGLAQSVSGLSAEILVEKQLMLLNRGALAEQFVGQELLAYEPFYQPGQLYFWDRNKKNSMAEVDYIINLGSKIIPIEVKSGSTGRLKSLHLFLEEKKLPFGVRISEKPLSYSQAVLSIPLYMVFMLQDLVLQARDTP